MQENKKYFNTMIKSSLITPYAWLNKNSSHDNKSNFTELHSGISLYVQWVSSSAFAKTSLNYKSSIPDLLIKSNLVTQIYPENMFLSAPLVMNRIKLTILLSQNIALANMWHRKLHSRSVTNKTINTHLPLQKLH